MADSNVSVVHCKVDEHSESGRTVGLYHFTGILLYNTQQ